MSRRGWLLFAAMSVIWGIPYLLIKVADTAMSPVFLVFCRTGGAALLLVPLAAARGQLRPLLSHWKMLLAYTVAEIGLPWLLLSDAEVHVRSSFAGLLVAAVPLVGAVLARLAGDDDRLDRRRLAGLLVGLAGVAALVGLDLRADNAWAIVEIGGTIVGYATGPLLISRYLAALPSTGVIAGSLGLAAVGYAPWALTHLPREVPAASPLLSVTVLALLCTAVAFVLFFALITEIGPARATVITYVNPAVAAVLGVTAGGEKFTAGMAVGFPLVLAGSYWATRRSRARVAAGEETAAPAVAEVGC